MKIKEILDKSTGYQPSGYDTPAYAFVQGFYDRLHGEDNARVEPGEHAPHELVNTIKQWNEAYEVGYNQADRIQVSRGL